MPYPARTVPGYGYMYPGISMTLEVRRVPLKYFSISSILISAQVEALKYGIEVLDMIDG